VSRATGPDGVALHIEEVGEGRPVVFLHEFAGDHRSWEPQLRHFARRHRCVVFAARGYPPSDVPLELDCYSQRQAVLDVLTVLDRSGIERAHVVGLSMGGFCALHLALDHPERCRSVVAGGVGYGEPPGDQTAFRAECEAIATAFEEHGSAWLAARYAVGPARVQLERKDPRAHAELAAHLTEHSAVGSALTMRGVQQRRPSLLADRGEDLARLDVPVLLLAGDEDEGCLEPALALKRLLPTAELAVFPRSGHVLNLEEPELFNLLVGRFIDDVDADTWRPRDLRAVAGSLTGMGG
jgi:pimeloyl-ACP methyl ester carboxylesterase